MRPERGILERVMIAAAGVVALLSTASAGFGDTYVVTPLTSGLSGRAHDISTTGAVCGNDLGRAFVWRPSSPNATSGTLSMLPSLIPDFSSDAYGVSSSGMVVGRTGDNPLVQHEVPVAWLPGGSITKLTLFNGVTSGGLASGINEAGRITGRNGLFISDAAPVLWNTDGTGTYLGNPQGVAASWGWKINAGGAIAGTAELSDGGSRAFVHANGLFTFLPLLEGATLTSAYDINDAGEVVGTSASTVGAATSFFYDGVAAHGLANVPGDLIQVSTALGLNNRRQIVGDANPTPNITGGVIWDNPGAAPGYLNNLIDPTSPGYVSASNPGWFITEAVAINDAGQIAARGVSTSGGSYKALLLTPVPNAVAGVDAKGERLGLTVTPNPAPGPVDVQFAMPRAGTAQLHVVDIRGRRVATLHDGFADAGALSIPWNARSANGLRLAPGIYFLRLEAHAVVASRRLVLIR